MTPTPINQIRKAVAKAKRERYHKQFDRIWASQSEVYPPVLHKELMFHGTRKWRFDYANPRTKIAIELNGGSWVNGRHNRGSGYEKDCEKLREAALLGWRVIPLTPKDITYTNLKRIAEAINSAN